MTQCDMTEGSLTAGSAIRTACHPHDLHLSHRRLMHRGLMRRRLVHIGRARYRAGLQRIGRCGPGPSLAMGRRTRMRLNE